MGAGFTYQGASGENYHFVLVETGKPMNLTWQGAVLVFATYAPNPISIASTHNVAGTILNLQGDLNAHGGTLLTFMLVENDAKRRDEIAHDLRLFYRLEA